LDLGPELLADDPLEESDEATLDHAVGCGEHHDRIVLSAEAQSVAEQREEDARVVNRGIDEGVLLADDEPTGMSVLGMVDRGRPDLAHGITHDARPDAGQSTVDRGDELHDPRVAHHLEPLVAGPHIAERGIGAVWLVGPQHHLVDLGGQRFLDHPLTGDHDELARGADRRMADSVVRGPAVLGLAVLGLDGLGRRL